MKHKLLLTILFFANAINFFGHEGKQPEKISYIKNNGQWENNILYKGKIGGGVIWVENNQFSFVFQDQNDIKKAHDNRHIKKPASDVKIKSHAYRMQFIGNNNNHQTTSKEKAQSFHNYYIGNDPTKWAGNVPLFHEVDFTDLYAGIDLKLYSSHDGYFKYDYIVKPGASASSIKWKYEGASPIIKEGKLSIPTNAGEVIEEKPYAYQFINGRKKEVACQYNFSDGILSFTFPQGYDATKELIIDPTLIFSSYTGSTADNWGFTATYDNSGSLYSGGIAFSAGYPTTAGAFDLTFNAGAVDVSISKFTPTGTGLVYSTYLGGSNSESPHSLIVDNAGNLYVMGTTGSSTFPVTAGCYDNTFNGGTSITPNGYAYTAGSDIFVTKFNSTGTVLIGSTFIGGTANDGFNTDATLSHNYADEMRGEIVLGTAGEVYVASSTLSTNFPTTAGAMTTVAPAGLNGCAFKLDTDLTALQWSTYLGGTSADAAYSIKPSATGDVYVTGGTLSVNFPTTIGVIKPIFGGGADGFITALSGAAGASVASTYIGTAAYDQSYLLEIDLNNDVYIAGQTKGAYPVTPSVYSNPGSSQFVHKMNPGLTTTEFSTVFGRGTTSSTDISLTAFLVDNCQNIYVSGWGGTINTEGTTTGLPVTGDAYDATTDGSDFYFIVLERDASSLLYATFFGGPPAEHVDGGTSRFDKNGTIYQAVCAGCGGSDLFPTTPGVWSTTNNSTNCNLGAIKMEFNYLGIIADANAAPNILACDPPYDVNFVGSASGVQHYWDFGDGTPTSNIINPIHTYTGLGVFTVMYVAIDSSTCNIADTVYLTVEILAAEVFSTTLNIPPYDPCVDSVFTVDLEFTGTGADSLFWSMGDGTTFINDTAISYTYLTTGTYIISLTAWDFTCSNTATITDTVYFDNSVLNATANAAPNIIQCDPPFDATFTGSGAPQHYWDFGDGTPTSSVANPTHTYTAIGNYTVTYVAIDSSTCNITDTVYLTVQVLEKEIFAATFSAVPPQPCQDTVFVNIQFTGTGADSLIWDMGDGTTFTNDSTVFYYYTSPGTYTLSLTAFDNTCLSSGTISQTINVDESALTGTTLIPNVFTPNNDGDNDRFQLLFSAAPGVNPAQYYEEYSMQIFNRWGKKIFESNTDSWDGRIDGKLANEGVYFYIIEYKEICLQEELKIEKGHVTVLR